MLSYLDWIDQRGFWVRTSWDKDKNEMGGVGKLYLFEHQRKLFGHCLSFGEDGRLPYETVCYSATKKTGKTTIGASVGAWYAEESDPGTEIYVIANDLESAEGRLLRDLKFHYEKWNEGREKKDKCKITQYAITFPNGTIIQALSQSYKSAAGSRHALTLWDELWGYSSEISRRMWDEMTPIPTTKNSLRFISTYAGFENESDLLWEIYLRGVGEEEHRNGQGTAIEGLLDQPCWSNGNLFVYWTHEPTMPWQTERYLQEQMKSERPMAFARLHMNQWVTSHEEFIPVQWWDKAAEAFEANALMWSEHPFGHWPITVGIDAGIKRDSTALVCVGYDSKRARVGVVYHKIWTPTPGNQIDLDATVEKELEFLYNKFKIVSIVYDPTHLMQTMFRLESKGLPTKQFDQTPSNMTAASEMLYDLLKDRKLEAYPDEEIRRHVQMSVAETSARGFRIVKNKVSKRHHIDAAIALAMACYEAVSTGGVDISVPVVIRSPFSDVTAWVDNEPSDKDVPFELRT